ISRLAGVSKGVSDSDDPVALISLSVMGKASLDTEIAGSVAVWARAPGLANSSATVAETTVRRGRTDVLTERDGMEILGRKGRAAVAMRDGESSTNRVRQEGRAHRAVRPEVRCQPMVAERALRLAAS